MNLATPVSNSYIIGAIILIAILIAIGLGIVKYYKNRSEN